MEENGIIIVDSIDQYNKLMGFSTKNPLVAVVDMSKSELTKACQETTIEYEVYSIWLKQSYCGDITYGRQPYDYQEGTVTAFAPGQIIHFKPAADYKPKALGLLFHPDLIRGTSLGHNIKQYDYFSYSSREALHLSEDEKVIFQDCLEKIKMEIERPIDKHSKKTNL